MRIKLALACVVVLFLMACSSNSSTSSGFTAGSEVYIRGGSATGFVASDSATLLELEKAQSANDSIGVSNLIQSGRVWAVNNGTKALVIDSDSRGGVNVRILEGRQTGRSGWTDEAWLTSSK